MIDMAQADQTLRFTQSPDGGVFDRFRARLAAYLADYINEELQRGATIDKYTTMDALMSFEGGADEGETP